MPDRIPALTIWQPWATLIAAGAKPYEWRGWPAPKWVIGRRIAIHAGARKVRREEIAELILSLEREGETGTSLIVPIALPLLHRWHTAPGSLPLSSVLCTAMLGEPITADAYVRQHGVAAADSDRIDHTKWGWPLTDIQPVEPMVPAKGAQGFWWWENGKPCDNCAFRPGSVEQRDTEKWRETIASLKAGARFYCHKGVPLDPAGENGFAYPTEKPSKLRMCRGWLRMWSAQMDREMKSDE